MLNSYVTNLFYSKKYIISWLFECYISKDNNIQKKYNLNPPEINIMERLEEGLLKYDEI